MILNTLFIELKHLGGVETEVMDDSLVRPVEHHDLQLSLLDCGAQLGQVLGGDLDLLELPRVLLLEPLVLLPQLRHRGLRGRQLPHSRVQHRPQLAPHTPS